MSLSRAWRFAPQAYPCSLSGNYQVLQTAQIDSIDQRDIFSDDELIKLVYGVRE
jgi:hypothetical protein